MKVKSLSVYLRTRICGPEKVYVSGQNWLDLAGCFVQCAHAPFGRARQLVDGEWRRLGQNKGVKIKQIARRAVQGGVPASSGDDLLRLIIDETMTTNVQSPSATRLRTTRPAKSRLFMPVPPTRLSKLKSKSFSLLDHAYKQRVSTRDLTSFIRQSGGLNFQASLSRKTKQKKGGSGK